MASKVGSRFKAGDKVVRNGTKGPTGVVQNIRIETTKNTIKQDGLEEPGVAVTVLWDNGTTSHFVPEGLEKI